MIQQSQDNASPKPTRLAGRLKQSAFLGSAPALTKGRVPDSEGADSPYMASVRKPSRVERQILHDALLESSPTYKMLDADEKDRQLRIKADQTVHLIQNQAPTILQWIVNAIHLPPGLGFISPVLAALNVATGIKALARDVQEVKRTLADPKSTRTDKVVDVGHLCIDVAHVVVDSLEVVAWVAPALVAIHNPFVLGAFAAAGVIGFAADVGKAFYDVHRKRQLNAQLETDQELVHEAIFSGESEQEAVHSLESAAPSRPGADHLKHRLRQVANIEEVLHQARAAALRKSK